MSLYITNVSATSSYIYQQNTAIDIKASCFDTNNSLCDSGTNCFITINNPNSTILVLNQSMTRNLTYYSYALSDTQTTNLGEHSVIIYCSGTTKGYSVFNYEITQNGKPNPTSGIIVLFIISFLIILFYLVTMLLYGLGKIATLSFSLKDLSLNFGGYFALFGLYMLEPQYLGNADIHNFLLLFIEIGSMTSVFLPLVGFI
jgi:hypothetical protein